MALPGRIPFPCCLGLAAVAALLAAPPAGAAVTIGSSLARVPALTVCVSDPCTVLQTTPPPDATLPQAFPTDGVVVRWRLRSLSAGAAATRLRILRPAGGSQYLAVSSSPSETASGGGVVSTFNTRQSVLAGDLIGVDTADTVFAFAGGAEVMHWGAPPPLADGTMSSPNTTSSARELLVNADLEPDADKDGYGDETQDQCPTDASRQACPAPPQRPSPQTAGPGRDLTPPGTRLIGARIQALERLAVYVVSNERGFATVSGRVTSEGASSSYRLRRVKRSLTANTRRKFRLSLSGSVRSSVVKRALRSGRRLSVRVRMIARDVAGNAAVRRRTIRLR